MVVFPLDHRYLLELKSISLSVFLCLLSFYLSLSFSYKDTVSGSFLEERFCGLEVGLAKIMQDAISEESKEQRRSQLLGENDALGLHRLSQFPHLSS